MSNFPDAISGYTRRSDEVVSALERAGLHVHRISTAALIERSHHCLAVNSSLADRIAFVAKSVADLIPPDAGALIAASDWRNGWIGALAARQVDLRFAYELRGVLGVDPRRAKVGLCADARFVPRGSRWSVRLPI